MVRPYQSPTSVPLMLYSDDPAHYRDNIVVDVWCLSDETREALDRLKITYGRTAAFYYKIFFPAAITAVEHSVYFFVDQTAFYLQRGTSARRQELDGTELILITKEHLPLE